LRQVRTDLEAKLELVRHQLITRLGGLMVVLAGLLFAALHYWPPHGWPGGRPMLDWLRYRYHLDRLQRKKRQTIRYFEKAWIQAKAEKKSEADLEALRAEENHELDFIEDNIHQLLHISHQRPKSISCPCPSSRWATAENGKGQTWATTIA
jgi:hypothetical protein